MYDHDSTRQNPLQSQLQPRVLWGYDPAANRTDQTIVTVTDPYGNITDQFTLPRPRPHRLARILLVVALLAAAALFIAPIFYF